VLDSGRVGGRAAPPEPLAPARVVRREGKSPADDNQHCARVEILEKKRDQSAVDPITLPTRSESAKNDAGSCLFEEPRRGGRAVPVALGAASWLRSLTHVAER